MFNKCWLLLSGQKRAKVLGSGSRKEFGEFKNNKQLIEGGMEGLKVKIKAHRPWASVLYHRAADLKRQQDSGFGVGISDQSLINLIDMCFNKQQAEGHY